jgi:pre-mRNA-splicing factor RBM22/SLT11
MTSIKKDATKQQWEQTEFPLVCETCLGDNPYLRMTVEPHGKPCQICDTPFTVFTWQAGSKGRLKRPEICKSCATAKNVCQVCIYDLEFGLPVGVRDKVLREEGGGGAVLAVPQSDANRSWYNAMQARMNDADGQCQPATTGNEKARAKLKGMARMEPRYERNLPKLCSFFAKGECDRGSACPFRHELPRDRNDPLAHQNTKDRFYGQNDVVARKLIWRQKEKEEREKEARGDGNADNEMGDERAVSTCYIRFDTRNEATLGIGISEQDVRDNFYAHGEITSIRMHQNVGAFCEYTTSEAADLAIISMDQKSIHGRKILVSWARQAKRGNLRGGGDVSSMNTAANGAASAMGPRKPLPPPGSKVGLSSLPKGFAPSAQVAAAAKARMTARSGLAKTGINVPRPGGVGLNVPRPGGGPIRQVGLLHQKRNLGNHKPYYPSADPARLGTKGVSD